MKALGHDHEGSLKVGIPGCSHNPHLRTRNLLEAIALAQFSELGICGISESQAQHLRNVWLQSFVFEVLIHVEFHRSQPLAIGHHEVL